MATSALRVSAPLSGRSCISCCATGVDIRYAGILRPCTTGGGHCRCCECSARSFEHNAWTGFRRRACSLQLAMVKQGGQREKLISDIEIAHWQESAGCCVGDQSDLQHGRKIVRPLFVRHVAESLPDLAAISPARPQQGKEQTQPRKALLAQHAEVNAVNGPLFGTFWRIRCPIRAAEIIVEAAA